MSWYLMQRGWQSSSFFGSDEFSRRDAWIWLIEAAAWAPTRAEIGRKRVQLERGELCHSVRFLADQWIWSKSKVSRFLNDLERASMIATRVVGRNAGQNPPKSGTGNREIVGRGAGRGAGQPERIITICNYAIYQDANNPTRDATRDATWDSEKENRGTPPPDLWDATRDKVKEIKQKEDSLGAASRGTPGSGTRLPDGWEPAPLTGKSAIAAARMGREQVDLHLERFGNYWRGLSGQRARKSDWDATWRNWLLKEAADQRINLNPAPRGGVQALQGPAI